MFLDKANEFLEKIVIDRLSYKNGTNLNYAALTVLESNIKSLQGRVNKGRKLVDYEVESAFEKKY